MGNDDGSGSDSSSDSRELGVEFGPLKEKLESHEYPTTGDELVEEYGDLELETSGGSETLREIIGKRKSAGDDDEDLQYESPDEVHQTILNMIDVEAVGRKAYSDRGSSLGDRDAKEEGDREDESM